MNKSLVWFTILVPLCAAPDSLFADGYLTVRNPTNAPAELWVWPEEENRYRQPQIYVSPGGTAKVSYRDNEQYWLLARDEFLREVPIGWYDISQLVRDDPQVVLNLKKVFEMRLGTVTYYVWDCRSQRWVAQTVIRRYIISRLVPEWSSEKGPGASTPRPDR